MLLDKLSVRLYTKDSLLQHYSLLLENSLLWELSCVLQDIWQHLWPLLTTLQTGNSPA